MFGLGGLAIRAYNAIHKRLWPYTRPAPRQSKLREIEDRALSRNSDISDHLSTIFCEAVAAEPRLIVELGVRNGESRFVLERAAAVTKSFLLSIDMDDCTRVCTRSERIHFIQADDVEFAAIFREWCSEQGLDPAIDLLFIDTSHLYDHSVQEIRAWFPHLSTRCKVIFHDTNLRKFIRRADGTIDWAWNNDRGVIRAIEEYLTTKLNERADFVTMIDDWIVRHWAHCNGLTVLERLPRSMSKPNRTGSLSREVHAGAPTSAD